MNKIGYIVPSQEGPLSYITSGCNSIGAEEDVVNRKWTGNKTQREKKTTAVDICKGKIERALFQELPLNICNIYIMSVKTLVNHQLFINPSLTKETKQENNSITDF